MRGDEGDAGICRVMRGVGSGVLFCLAGGPFLDNKSACQGINF